MELNVLFVRTVIEIVLPTVTASVKICIEIPQETEVTTDIGVSVGSHFVNILWSCAMKAIPVAAKKAARIGASIM